MHPSSMKNMKICYEKYILGNFLNNKNDILVLDVGSKNINGSYKEIFNNTKIKYIGLDLEKGKGVDIVTENPYHYPVNSESADVVISGQTFEHCEFFWEAFLEMNRVLRKGGYIFLISPSIGRIHRYPVDCYRFNPDSYSALAKYAKIKLIEVWLDKTSNWGDVVGVFKK